jgi:3-deoxy-D-manno-octulosonate 8-phosphate phosphatase (KDO 8-P phosphatase)
MDDMVARRQFIRRRRIRLARKELAERAKRVKLVLTDCDGVLTDAGVYYSAEGEMLKRFSIRDGMGVKLLRKAGIEVAIITGEKSENVRRRGEKLQMKHLYLGFEDKAEHLPTILKDTGCTMDQVAYIGDDVNDLDCINTIGELGLTGAPADAMPPVSAAVHYRCKKSGGDGAFREFADWILLFRGKPIT